MNINFRYLYQNGFRDVQADLHGHTQPDIITWTETGRGHIPDVTANNGQLHVFEVETDDSIYDQHTEDQWNLFANFAQQHGARFWIVVPKGSESDAQLRLNQLGLQAKIWTV